MRISNVKVYDLEESLIASGYPFAVSISERPVTRHDLERGLSLTKASRANGAHAQWLTGVRVNFDLTLSNKAWVEAERYRFLEFVSSQSTVHRITKFDLKEQCNSYVDPRIIDVVQSKINEYTRLAALEGYNKEREEQKRELYLEILYNLPSGFELTARMTTNYRCLLNIYNQRHDHRLPEWREFCEELLELPHFEELVETYCDKN